MGIPEVPHNSGTAHLRNRTPGTIFQSFYQSLSDSLSRGRTLGWVSNCRLLRVSCVPSRDRRISVLSWSTKAIALFAFSSHPSAATFFGEGRGGLHTAQVNPGFDFDPPFQNNWHFEPKCFRFRPAADWLRGEGLTEGREGWGSRLRPTLWLGKERGGHLSPLWCNLVFSLLYSIQTRQNSCKICTKMWSQLPGKLNFFVAVRRKWGDIGRPKSGPGGGGGYYLGMSISNILNSFCAEEGKLTIGVQVPPWCRLGV